MKKKKKKNPRLLNKTNRRYLKKLKITTKFGRTSEKKITEASKKDASSWLSTLPLDEFSFDLNKGEFRDDLKLLFGEELLGLPSLCLAGSALLVSDTTVSEFLKQT